jgi:hypothetical protein
MFCAPELVFYGTECVGSCFQVFRAVLNISGTEGVRSRFHVLRSLTRFRRCRGRPVPFLCFALQDMFSTEMSASGPVFMCCTPGLVFGGPEGDGSSFHVLRSGTSFWRYRGRRVPFLCSTHTNTFSAVRRASGHVFMFCAPHSFSGFVLPESFPAVPRASGPVFKFCAPELAFGGTACIGSRFQILRSRIHFRLY